MALHELNHDHTHIFLRAFSGEISWCSCFSPVCRVADHFTDVRLSSFPSQCSFLLWDKQAAWIANKFICLFSLINHHCYFINWEKTISANPWFSSIYLEEKKSWIYFDVPGLISLFLILMYATSCIQHLYSLKLLGQKYCFKQVLQHTTQNLLWVNRVKGSGKWRTSHRRLEATYLTT